MKIRNITVFGIIYKIENTVNKKVYIGKTTKGFTKRYNAKGSTLIEKVYNKHKDSQRNGNYYNIHLINAIEKYGLGVFVVNPVLDFAFSESELNIKEKVWIKLYNSFVNGYNNTIGGDGTCGIERPKRNESYKPTKVVCLNDKKIFDCILDASVYYDVSKTSISANCSNNIIKYSVRQRNGNSLVFMYYDEYLKTPEDIIKKKLNYKYTPKSKGVVYNLRKIICTTTNEIFYSFSEVEEKYNLPTANLVKCCKQQRNFCGKIGDKKLKWMYYEDYLITKDMK